MAWDECMSVPIPNIPQHQVQIFVVMPYILVNLWGPWRKGLSIFLSSGSSISPSKWYSPINIVCSLWTINCSVFLLFWFLLRYIFAQSKNTLFSGIQLLLTIKIWSSSITFQSTSCCPYIANPSDQLQPLATSSLFSIPIFLPFPECHINRCIYICPLKSSFFR